MAVFSSESISEARASVFQAQLPLATTAFNIPPIHKYTNEPTKYHRRHRRCNRISGNTDKLLQVPDQAPCFKTCHPVIARGLEYSPKLTLNYPAAILHHDRRTIIPKQPRSSSAIWIPETTTLRWRRVPCQTRARFTSIPACQSTHSQANYL
jgi:hypothetical protein